MTVNLKEIQAMKHDHKAVIDPVRHERLLADLEGVLARAHIPKAALFESATGVLNEAELYWLTEYRVNAQIPRGFVLVGQPKPESPGPEKKMMAICGALLRNYVDAQVLSLNSVLESLDADPPDCTVLLIPNLYLKQGGKTLPSWQMQRVYDLLLSRLTSSRITCCYVESLDALGADYGHNLASHLRDQYMVLPA
jgi:hypothetical protein